MPGILPDFRNDGKISKGIHLNRAADRANSFVENMWQCDINQHIGEF